MTLDELQAEADKDLVIDDTELDTESLRTPILHNKYLQYYNKFNLLLKKSQWEERTLQREKWEYYTGKSDPEVYKEKPFDLKVLKNDVPIYINADEDIQKIQAKIIYQEAIVNYLEQILRMINNRSFTIKNAIEWRRFTSGAL
ncbi:MAG: hypothetical protein CBE28_00595 [Pelagibacteraceae bacterium TMED268]|nr:MAG: hypothetical protein CBE28_00595 [Pelagibacteraceae bacterium TMED268]|tara:strand:- start:14 stop:442 length:429 start_codon:yes stop_codon:yes gene_type:complete